MIETSHPGKQSLNSPSMLITKRLNFNLSLILNNGSRTFKIRTHCNSRGISAKVKMTTEVLLKCLVQNKKRLDQTGKMLGMKINYKASTNTGSIQSIKNTGKQELQRRKVSIQLMISLLTMLLVHTSALSPRKVNNSLTQFWKIGNF